MALSIVPMSKVVVNIEEVANTTAGTIPLALAHAAQDGRLVPGSRVNKIKQRADHHKPAWNWTLYRHAVIVEFLEAIRPWLGERRGAKADEAIAFIQSKEATCPV